jgi:riboflavin kinase/FMN adenylyltransferase
VGEDFRFGTGAVGTVITIESHGEGHGYRVMPQGLVVIDGRTVTSTLIRTLVAEGRVAEAARLLGRPHRLRGPVVRGRGIGSDLGTPTANIRIREGTLRPGDGVYAALAYGVGEHPVAAAVSVGSPPTYPGAPAVIEAHLVGVETDLYETALRLDLVDRLRDIVAFDSETDLSAAIAADVAHVKELLST